MKSFFCQLFFIIFIGISSQVQSAKHWKESTRAIGTTSNSLNVDRLNSVFVGLSKKLSPSVVLVQSKFSLSGFTGGSQMEDDMFRYFFGNPFGGPFGTPPRNQKQFSQSMGSGFVLNDKGYLLTNNHVVSDKNRLADEVRVRFLGEDMSTPGHLVEIVGTDPSIDVAVLKLTNFKKEKLRSVILGNSDITQVGEWVIAIGNPYGHSFTVTKGIVSALGRDLDDLKLRSSFIQTDASINVGNSGGPLFNLHGEVIGINTAIDARAQGIGFAVPINAAKYVAKQLIETGRVKRGFIGVGVTDLTTQLAKSLGLKKTQRGALVREVFENGPAYKAGLRPYDVIVKMNGKKVTKTTELQRINALITPGTKVKVEYLRNGKLNKTQVTIASMNQNQPRLKRKRKTPRKRFQGNSIVENRIGIVLKDLSISDRKTLGMKSNEGGVFVDFVNRGSVAHKADIRPGDVILEINRNAVANVNGAKKAFVSGKSYMLRIKRGRHKFILFFEIDG